MYSTIQAPSARRPVRPWTWRNGKTLPIGVAQNLLSLFPQPPIFVQKFAQLSTVRHPTDGESVIQKLGLPCLKLQTNAAGGQRYNWLTGEMVSIDNNTPPCVVYGPIYDLWNGLGNVESGWGRPIADVQYLDDGSCCSVFEGGHIHSYGETAKP